MASSDPLGTTHASWVIEGVGPGVALSVAIFFVIQTKRNRRLSVPALLFIGTTTMFWQEFYADWGAFLYYNQSFVELPWWGRSAYTTPNKPLFVVFGYGWFYAGAFPGLLLVLSRVRRRLPSWPRWIVVVGVVGPLFFAWNLTAADGAAFLGHWWNYIQSYGPTVHTSQGQLAFLYPALTYVAYAVLTLGIIDVIDANGQCWFERRAGLCADGSGWRYEARRAVTWAVGMNVFYAAFFTIPTVLTRLLFFGSNPLIP